MGKRPALYLTFLGALLVATLAACQLSAIISGTEDGFNIHLSVPATSGGAAAGSDGPRYLTGSGGTVSVSITRNDSTGTQIFSRDLSVQTAADGTNSATVTATGIPTETPLRLVAKMVDQAGLAYLQIQRDFTIQSGTNQDLGISLAPNPDYPGRVDLAGLTVPLVVPARGTKILAVVADDTFLNIYNHLAWTDDAGALSVAVMDSQGIVPSSVVTSGVVRGVVFRPQASGLHYCLFSNNTDADVDVGIPGITKNVAVAVFDTAGGTTIDPVVVLPGTTIPAPPAPTRTSFVFGGWYSDAACTPGNELTFPLAVNTLFTIHAKWYAVPVVEITFSLGNPAYQGLVFPSTNPSWLKSSSTSVWLNCSNADVNTNGTDWKWYVDGVAVTSTIAGHGLQYIFEFMPSAFAVGEHVLSASVLYQTVRYSGDMKFTVLPDAAYSITYSASGADSGTPPTDPVSYSPGATATVLGNPQGLGRTNCVFLGWTESPTGIGTILAPGATLVVNNDMTLYPAWMVMLSVPAGSFQRDTSSSNISTVSAFLMGQTEVTKAEYDRVMGTSSGDGQYPMGQVSVFDAVIFCNRLSMLSGLEPVYSIKGSTNPDDWGNVPRSVAEAASDPAWDTMIFNREASGFRLPTEMEWDWAAMGADRGNPGALNTTGYQKEFAGDPNPTVAGDDPAPYGIFTPVGDSEISAIPVKSLLPNELGFYDMSGNVYEYVQDVPATWPLGTLVDYCKETSSTTPVNHYQKGGCSKHDPSLLAPIDRSRDMWASYVYYYDDFGFRVMRKAASGTYVPRSGLVAEWLLNSTGGVNDTSGNGLSTDSVGNLALATDHRGTSNQALTMGTGLIGASFGYNPVLAIAGNANQSISFWFRTGTGFLPTGSIIFMIGQNALNSGEIDYSMALSGNDLVAYVSNHNNNSCSASTPVVNDTWYHVVRTYDGTYLKLYLNGVLKSSTPVPPAYLALPQASASVTSAFTLNCSTTNPYPGALDDLRIYNRILSDAEIHSLYQK